MADRVETTIGTIHDCQMHRDAIHIAVAQVTASERLAPAQQVAFADGGTEKVRASGKAVGIIDPFLPAPVFPGEQCWLFLYPMTITSLRHEWTHPAFSEEERRSTKENSEAWLRAFVKRSDCPGYEDVVAAAVRQKDATGWDAEYLHFDGLNAHSEIPAEFWDHVEVVTGVSVPNAARARSFSCSC